MFLIESPTTAMQMTVIFFCQAQQSEQPPLFSKCFSNWIYSNFLHLNFSKTGVLVLDPNSFSKELSLYIASLITSDHLLQTLVSF